jgi:hypothetical protein
MAARRGGPLAEEEANAAECLRACCTLVALLSVAWDGPFLQEISNGKIAPDRH